MAQYKSWCPSPPCRPLRRWLELNVVTEVATRMLRERRLGKEDQAIVTWTVDFDKAKKELAYDCGEGQGT